MIDGCPLSALSASDQNEIGVGSIGDIFTIFLIMDDKSDERRAGKVHLFSAVQAELNLFGPQTDLRENSVGPWEQLSLG